MAKGNQRHRRQPKQQAPPSQPEQPTRPRWKTPGEWADWKDVRTYLVIAALGGVGFGITWLYNWQQERSETRTTISEEIPHRITFARQHVANDVNLAKKYLDGVDPRFCRHEELVGVPLRKLLDDWQSAGGDEINREIASLAANPTPTTEQVQHLLVLLDQAFPEPDASQDAP